MHNRFLVLNDAHSKHFYILATMARVGVRRVRLPRRVRPKEPHQYFSRDGHVRRDHRRCQHNDANKGCGDLSYGVNASETYTDRQ